MKNPNLFAYMRAANFSTSVINAQNALARPPNFMTDADIDGLDSYLQVLEEDADLDRYETDQQVPSILENIISKNERSFSYVIKMGAHFPYSGSYPPERAWFEPADYLDGHSEREAEIISSYMNALRWSTDEFITQLLPALERTGKDVLVVYTSDHGQSLYDEMKNGNDPVRGHGQHQAPPSHQAMIPLFLLPLGDELRGRMSELYEPALTDQLSAFELFSSLLFLAGYAPEQIREHYTPSIFDAEAQRATRAFISGNHFGADGPLYREAPYRSSFSFNEFDPAP
jgi:glucan phosphoethanolaminetransferase (alkaline phosphatase superfamily)